MKHPKLESLGNDELVNRFADICIAQDVALLYSDIAKFNRLYAQLMDIESELRRRSGDQRRALIALFDHDNAQVRLQAARFAYATAPAKARATIEAIAKSKKGPQNGDAGMTLDNLDRGIFKPK